MSMPMSIRLREPVRERLKRRASETGEAPAALAARLVDEGLRMADHPLVTFRNTPAGGRVAGIANGPDVSDVLNVVQGLESRGEERVAEAAEWLGVPTNKVRAAIAYYAEFRDEIDAELALRQQVAEGLRARLAREGSVLR